MGILQELSARFRPDKVKLQLDDIQALILRSRPEPYVGIHSMIHVDEAAGGRDLLRRLADHIPAASGWTDELDSWTGVAISYDGLKALGLPETSLESFPLAFQQGMAARAEQLRDFGENAPETWEDPYRPGTCHIALTIYARDDDALDDVLAKAEAELEKSTGITLIGTHRFGADEDAKNPFGFRDSISQPLVDGSGVDQRLSLESEASTTGYADEETSLAAYASVSGAKKTANVNFVCHDTEDDMREERIPGDLRSMLLEEMRGSLDRLQGFGAGAIVPSCVRCCTTKGSKSKELMLRGNILLPSQRLKLRPIFPLLTCNTTLSQSLFVCSVKVLIIKSLYFSSYKMSYDSFCNS